MSEEDFPFTSTGFGFSQQLTSTLEQFWVKSPAQMKEQTSLMKQYGFQIAKGPQTKHEEI